MRKFGVEISRPVLPTSLTLSEDASVLNDPQAYPVRVGLQTLLENGEVGPTETVHAKFVIGADGQSYKTFVRSGFVLQFDKSLYRCTFMGAEDS